MEQVRRQVNGIKAQIERYPWWAIIAIALLLFGAGFGCGYYRGTRILGDSNRTKSIERELDQAEENQRAITERAEDAAQRTGDIQSRIDRGKEAVSRAEESAGRIDGSLQEAGSLIDDCERILEDVCQRGKANQAQD